MKLIDIKLQSDIPSDLPSVQSMLWSAIGELARLRDENILLRKGVFGKKTERFIERDDTQMQLVDLLAQVQPSVTAPDCDAPVTITTIQRRRKKHPGRNAIPEDIPTQEHIIDVPEEEKTCSVCKTEMPVIEQTMRTVIERIPATYTRHVYIRIKRGCPSCKDTVVVAEPPLVTPIAKGLAGLSLLVFVIMSKYHYHLPLYRIQRQIFHESRIWFTRTTMIGWIARLCVPLERIRKAMIEEIKSSRCVHADESPVTQVGVEDGSAKTYMWVYVNIDETTVVFDHQDTRASKAPLGLLRGIAAGARLMTDDYVGYDPVVKEYGLIAGACMMHIRREFIEAIDVGSKKEWALRVVRYIGQLYRIERYANNKKASSDQRLVLRQTYSKPIMDKIKTMLRDPGFPLLPSGRIGRAVTYFLNNWDKACRFLEAGDLPIDNGACERAIRALAIGRKNWMFIASDNGGKDMAILYSIITTCKLLCIEPEKYLADVLMRCAIRPASASVSDLTPLQWTKALNSGKLPEKQNFYPSKG